MMRPFYYLMMLILLLSCQSAPKPPNSDIVPPTPPGIFSKEFNEKIEDWQSSVTGVYSTPKYGSGGVGLALYSDGTYEFRTGSCRSSSLDSGSYFIKRDSVFFDSDFTERERNYSWRGEHDQIAKISSGLLLNNTILIAKRDLKLYKLGNYHFEVEAMDVNGNGEGFKLDSTLRRFEEGLYYQYLLKDGTNTTFDRNSYHEKVVKGFKLVDSLSFY